MSNIDKIELICVFVFDTFSKYINRSGNKNLIAEIYRAAAESMVDENYEQKLKNILNATEQAGVEIIKSRHAKSCYLIETQPDIYHPTSLRHNRFYRTVSCFLICL